MTRLIRIERHDLGPRVHLFGRRVHEYQAGFAAVLLGSWLVLKDWPDLFPATRDRAAWRLGIHRIPRRST
jgi:hypothetical protein